MGLDKLYGISPAFSKVMKPHLVNTSNNFIAGWYFDTPLWDQIISVFNSDKDFVRMDETGNHRGYTVANLLNMDAGLYTEYLLIVDKVLKEYKKIYGYVDNVYYYAPDSDINIQKYSPGKFYSNWHCENAGWPATTNNQDKRHLVFLTYLNTVKEGGETEFFYQNTKIKPEKGLTIIWPSIWTHTHRGAPAPKEVKYITTGWYVFLESEPTNEPTK